MYAITDLNGVTTLVSYQGLHPYLNEVIGLKQVNKDTHILDLLLLAEEQGYKVDYATDNKGNYIYSLKV